jgi:hypothetical protein
MRLAWNHGKMLRIELGVQLAYPPRTKQLRGRVAAAHMVVVVFVMWWVVSATFLARPTIPYFVKSHEHES